MREKTHQAILEEKLKAAEEVYTQNLEAARESFERRLGEEHLAMERALADKDSRYREMKANYEYLISELKDSHEKALQLLAENGPGVRSDDYAPDGTHLGPGEQPDVIEFVEERTPQGHRPSRLAKQYRRMYGDVMPGARNAQE